MNSLDTLSMAGTELTTEQLDEVDGGLILVIIGLAVLDVIIWKKVYDTYN